MSVDIFGQGWRVLSGSCLDRLPELADNSVDAVVCDPPYELGFMGKKWDSSGIAFDVSVWVECLRVLKPGGHLLAFSGTRTYHRMTVAIEDSGFEVRDMIAWISNKTFPKSHNIGKATGLAEWAGWGTALKPTVEPIVLARKPLIGTVAANVLGFGTGGLNIDGSRIATDDYLGGGTFGGIFGASRNEDGSFPQAIGSGDKGRWPANVMLDEFTAQLLDEQSGVSKSQRSNRGEMSGPDSHDGWNRDAHRGFTSVRGYEDSGGASRFFYVAKASKRDRNEGLEHLEERMARKFAQDETTLQTMPFEKLPVKNFHPTVKPTDLMRYLVKLVTPPGGVVLDPFTGSGSTGKAAILEGFEFIGCELTDDYLPIIEGRLNHAVEAVANQKAEAEAQENETLF